MHKAVEKYFRDEYANKPGYVARTEVRIPGVGRADMVLTTPTGERQVYELKPASYAIGSLHRAAEGQLNDYVNALNTPMTPTQAGGEFAPQTVIDYPGDPSKQIELWSDPSSPGLIYYIVTKKPQPQTQPAVDPTSLIVPLLILGAGGSTSGVTSDGSVTAE
ncbi:MAG TPA: hypothetical protein VNT75_25080 [Symbiobacteriaceae bacterium]|nr:hypothetical protein [Symbiobacteriaceae bacterium]